MLIFNYKAVLAYVAYTWSWSDSGKSYWGESEYASPTLYVWTIRTNFACICVRLGEPDGAPHFSVELKGQNYISHKCK